MTLFRVVDDEDTVCMEGFDDMESAAETAEMLDRENEGPRHHVEVGYIVWQPPVPGVSEPKDGIV